VGAIAFSAMLLACHRGKPDGACPQCLPMADFDAMTQALE